jgi:hypothetical protein
LKPVIKRGVLICCLAIAGVCNALQSGHAGMAHDLGQDPFLRAASKTLARAYPLYSEAVRWDSIDWRKYTTIIISGPQRSGTTFFCRALAAHLGYRHIDEKESVMLEAANGEPGVHVHVITGNRHDIIAETSELLRVRARVVIQRPRWSYALKLLPASPILLVIMLARNCLDVLNSQNRIKWTCYYALQGGGAARPRPQSGRW